MRKKVLLVDDVRLFLKLEETFFKRTGCKIFTAESGGQALDLAKREVPDVILLDFIMPDMMGDEVLMRLKSDDATAGIPVIVVSTSSDKKDIEKCFAAGADEYVTKPIEAGEILSKAANILNIPQRIHYRFPVKMKVAGSAAALAFAGVSRNISRGGLLVESSEQAGEGAELLLELPILPDNGKISMKGKVMRVERDNDRSLFLIGVQFLSLDDTQKDALAAFIDMLRK